MFNLLQLLLVILSIVCILILYQYFYKRRYGIWLSVTPKDTIGRDIDDSLTWKVKFLNFGLLSQQKPITIPQGSKLISYFNGVSMLDIYDKKLNHIQHYYNPSIIIQEEGRDLFCQIEYYFMLRYHSSMESSVEANTFLQIEPKPVTTAPIYDIEMKNCFDESQFRIESKEMMKKIIEEMDKVNYTLEEITISETRRSFPTSMLINELFLELEPGTKVIILATNKKKLFNLKDHSIEFDSEDKQFIWNPKGNKNFCSLVLEGNDPEGVEYESDEEEEDIVEINVSEFLYCESSKILPLTAMTFVPN